MYFISSNDGKSQVEPNINFKKKINQMNKVITHDSTQVSQSLIGYRQLLVGLILMIFLF